MGLEVIDGTVEAATPPKSNGKRVIYKNITFRLADGTERRFGNLVVAPSVAEMLQPGSTGRFYGYSAIDHKGMFAARTQNGRSDFIIPSGNERNMKMMMIVGALAFAVTLFARNGIMFLAVIVGIAGAIGYVRYRKTRLEAQTRYNADAGYAATFAPGAPDGALPLP